MRNFEYVSAETSERAVELLSVAGADLTTRPRIIAGGTDLLDEMKEGIIAPTRLVNIKKNEALRAIHFDLSKGMRVGALATLADLAAHPELRRHYGAVADAVGMIATPQIRNKATVGGNLCQRPRCWYYRDEALRCARKGGMICYAVDGENAYHAILGGDSCFIVHPSDLAPALVAHGAEITYRRANGRRTIPLESFFIGPGEEITRENVLAPNEVVEEIAIPPSPAGARGVYLKARERSSSDFATVSVAAVLEMDGETCRRGHVVLGAVAPVPWPAPQANRLLAGTRITTSLSERVADAALDGASPLEHNGYKVPLAKALVRRAILEAAGIAPQGGTSE